MSNPTIAALLEEKHGDLHEVIPRLVNERGQAGAAEELRVRQTWISRWLKDNGYIKIEQWVKEKKA